MGEPLQQAARQPGAMPGAAALGVVGGGQLGRMFAQAAQQLGYRVVVLDPEPQGPAGQVAARQIVAAYDDAGAVRQLGQATQACTTEFENVPAATLELLGAHGPVSPPPHALAVCQDRALEKAHFLAQGVPCAPHARIDSEADCAAAASLPLFPALLKTATLGYDGKGQACVASAAELPGAWAQLGRPRCLLEQRLALRTELSVIVARGFDGRQVHLPVQQNLHRDGILAVTQVPAPDIPEATAAQAVAHAARLADGLGYVGVLCVEFFVLDDGQLVANEMAPRPHNSGHHSIDSCDISQFELQVRTLAGLPLCQPRQHSAALMLNLLGDLWFPGAAAGPVEPPWASVLALPGVHLHLYGKASARRGRKMGHLTVTGPDAPRVREIAAQAARLLGLPAW